MPRIDSATLESAASVIELTKKFIPDPAKAFQYWESVLGQLNVETDGSVRLRPLVIAIRRSSIQALFNGKNHAEVAEKLKIPVKTVKRDVAMHYNKPTRRANRRRSAKKPLYAV